MILQIKNLCVNREAKIVLENISFQVEKKSILTIIGESGVGKSTLLKTLNGLIPLSKGTIYYQNNDINTLNLIEYRKDVCYIPQIPVELSDTIIEEFKLIKPEIAKEEISGFLKSFKLNDNILKRNMKTLSIGEQLRFSIIRGLLNSPAVMLLDEPTSALDEDNISLLKKIILRLNTEKDMTFIIVTHNLDMAKQITTECFQLTNKSIRKIKI